MTAQKYIVIYAEDGNTACKVFDYKKELRAWLKTIELGRVKALYRGKALAIRIEERLTV